MSKVKALNMLILINGWSDSHISGGDYHILKVSNNWARDHHISYVIPSIGRSIASLIIGTGSKIYVSSDEVKISGFLGLCLGYIRRMIRTSLLNLEVSPDVVVSSSHFLYDVFPAVILKHRSQSKLVVFFHGLISTANQSGLSRKISLISEGISIMFSKNADIIFVVNKHIKEKLVAKGFDPFRIYVVGNGVDVQEIKSVEVVDKQYNASFCGRLTKQKGVYDLIDICENVVSQHPDFKLVVVGKGPEQEKVKKLIETRGLQRNIKFTGFLYGREKIIQLKSSRLFVYPSYEETWGIAVAEAVVCGLPIICYNLHEYDKFGDTLIRVGIGNKNQMAEKIIDLISREQERREIPHRASNGIMNFSWDNISELEIEQIIRSSNI